LPPPRGEFIQRLTRRYADGVVPVSLEHPGALSDSRTNGATQPL